MLLKNLGFRMKQYAITFCSVPHTMKFDIKKAGNMFFPVLVSSPKPSLS